MRILCHSRVTIPSGPGQTSTKRKRRQRGRINASKRAQKPVCGRTLCATDDRATMRAVRTSSTSDRMRPDGEWQAAWYTRA